MEERRREIPCNSKWVKQIKFLSPFLHCFPPFSSLSFFLLFLVFFNCHTSHSYIHFVVVFVVFLLLPHCLVNNVGIKKFVVHCYLVVVLILEQHNNYFGQTYNICMWVTKYVVFIWANPKILSPFPFIHLDCINWINETRTINK